MRAKLFLKNYTGNDGGRSLTGLILQNEGMHAVQPKKGMKVQCKGTIVNFCPSSFQISGIQNATPPKQHAFLEFHVENKVFHFSKRALRAGTARKVVKKKAIAISKNSKKLSTVRFVFVYFNEKFDNNNNFFQKITENQKLF